MQAGQKVTVMLFGGGQAERRVISDKGKVVVICSEEEFQEATQQNRVPEGLGFPREDVIERKPPATHSNSEDRRAEAGD